MSLNINDTSIVHWFPTVEKHMCGYCKSENGSISYGMWADTLTVRDYQRLIDRGWRRSGRYCYKPIMSEICCPQYPIRCEAALFKISKSHKKIIKKFNRFLSDGILHKSSQSTESESNDQDPMFFLKERPNTTFDYKNVDLKLNEGVDNISASSSHTDNHMENPDVISNQSLPEKVVKKARVIESSENTTSSQVKKGVGADPNKAPCKKAKLLRLERKQQKMMEKGMVFIKSNSQIETKTLEELLQIPEDCKDKLKIKLVSTSTTYDFSDFAVEYEIYKKYQMIIHKDPPEKCSKETFNRFLVNTPLKMKLARMCTGHETFEASYKLFAKYQMFVHHDDESECDVNQFIEFLVESPLKGEVCPGGDIGFGSFHQQYWIDDKLIAVGVIDILPKGLSSVYFFYDPDYRSLTLGTYGSLREVDFTRTLHHNVPTIQYYYMGFYIHSCPKMRYKGRLVPSELLCPETYRWFPITESTTKLEENKYSRLNPDPRDVDEHACTANDIDRIKIFLLDGYVYFKSYKYRSIERKTYQNVGKLVGRQCVDTLLFISQRH